jgi:Ca2+-binding RTX toxin-like protein
MAYAATGTAGNDTLNQAGDAGPGTIVGLAGDDAITVGTGLATVTGDSGNDSVLLQTGNTGTISGGTENDSIHGTSIAIGSTVLLGGDGADTIILRNFASPTNTTAPQTILGGNDSSDGADSIRSGDGPDLVFGNGGNDTLTLGFGADTAIGGFGDDLVAIFFSPAARLYFGNEGNDTLHWDGDSTMFGGVGNDSVESFGVGRGLVFGNEGNDTVLANSQDAVTIVGGQDSADGADSLLASTGGDIVFGNGGADTIAGRGGADTAIGGFGGDSILTTTAADLIFANESNDTVDAGDGNNTVFGGQGNDTILAGAGRDTLQGNEGNDTIAGDIAGGITIDTIAGGAGNDVFSYVGAGNGGQDGNNAAGGGPVELVTDVDYSVDRFDTQLNVTFAANMGAGTGANLNAAATNALAAAFALGGSGGAQVTAAQFTFSGHTYLVIEQTGAGTAAFDDTTDLLLDITGATGTIANSNFI